MMKRRMKVKMRRMIKMVEVLICARHKEFYFKKYRSNTPGLTIII